MACTL